MNAKEFGPLLETDKDELLEVSYDPDQEFRVRRVRSRKQDEPIIEPLGSDCQCREKEEEPNKEERKRSMKGKLVECEKERDRPKKDFGLREEAEGYERVKGDGMRWGEV